MQRVRLRRVGVAHGGDTILHNDFFSFQIHLHRFLEILMRLTTRDLSALKIIGRGHEGDAGDALEL